MINNNGAYKISNKKPKTIFKFIHHCRFPRIFLPIFVIGGVYLIIQSYCI